LASAFPFDLADVSHERCQVEDIFAEFRRPGPSVGKTHAQIGARLAARMADRC